MASQRICSIDECDKPHLARGLCAAHYMRWWHHGDPLTNPIRVANGVPLEFFQTTVLTYEGDDCLIWPFYRNRKGYAQLWYEGRLAIVSRLVCERVHGPAPTASHQSAHSCGKGHEGCVSRTCVYWATPKENQADRIIHGTSNRGERCGAAKLTEADVFKIRRLLGTMTQRAIGERFGVSRQAIKDIKTGKNWSWLD